MSHRLGKSTALVPLGAQRKAVRHEPLALMRGRVRVQEDAVRAIGIASSSGPGRQNEGVEVDDLPFSLFGEESRRTLSTNSPGTDCNALPLRRVRTARMAHPGRRVMLGVMGYVAGVMVEGGVEPQMLRRERCVGRRHRSGLHHCRGIHGQRNPSIDCGRKRELTHLQVVRDKRRIARTFSDIQSNK